MLLQVPKVNVRIYEGDDGYLRACVVQAAADGPVEGKNLLTSRQVRSVATAKFEARRALQGKVGGIKWVVEEFKA